jgi:2-polyprenyl-6-methoxyphenol hydroxylase-like FAD-dependent oxidoreductase
MSPAAGQTRGRALIVGGSLAGLLTANLLRQSGWDVGIYERAGEPLSERGAGIATHPRLLDLLVRAGVSLDRPIGMSVSKRIAYSPDGRILAQRTVAPQVVTGWSRIYQMLRDLFPDDRYHQGKNLTGFAEDDDGVTAMFADGTEVRADILIGADGSRSTVRGLLMPTVKPAYAGYIGWRGLVEESAMSEATHAAIFEKMAFCLPPREQILAYPIAGAQDVLEPGKRRYNYVWYRAVAEEAVIDLLTDMDGHYHPNGIPPSRIRSDLIDDIRRIAERILSPYFAEIVHRTEQPFFQLIYDLKAPNMAFGRVAIIGDAAFIARPHPAMGVTKAADDAAHLADVLGQADASTAADALLEWEKVRRAASAAVVDHARRLGAYIEDGPGTEEHRKLAEFHSAPERVIVETAAPPPPSVYSGELAAEVL